MVSNQYLFAHPGGNTLVHAPLEGAAESTIAVEAALIGQLLGDNGLLCSGKLAVAGYEVSDTKVVDVFIVAYVLTGEILTEIGLSVLRSFNVSTRHSRRPASGNPVRWAMVDIT